MQQLTVDDMKAIELDIMDEIDPGDGLVILHQGRVLFTGTAAEAAPDGDLTAAFLAMTGGAP